MDDVIDADAIRDELDRVTNSKTFARSSRMQELVRYLVHNDLAGNGDRLRSFNIAIDVFGRNADFDPSNDSIVRVEAARLRRMLTNHYLNHLDSKVQISIPKGRYLPAYEFVGLARLKPATPNPTAEHSNIGGPGIAILPFAGGASEQTVCAGLTYELHFQLGRFAEFRVVDASSLTQIPPAQLLLEVANTLDCQYLIKGQIVGTGSGLRVHASALDVSNAHVLWSERFDVELNEKNRVSVEENIAISIARSLAPAPGPLVLSGFERADRPPEDWDAIDCVLRWHHYRAHLHSATVNHNLAGALRRVLDQHPGFSLGWAIYAYLELDKFIHRMNPDLSKTSVQQTARTYAERALGLSQNNSVARYVLGLCDYFDGDHKGFRDNFFQALKLNPNSLDLMHHGGTLLAFSGAWKEGKALVLEADMSYSNSMGLRFFYVVDALREGDTKLASRLLSVVKPHGTWYWGHLLRAIIAQQNADTATALNAIANAFIDNPHLEGALDDEIEKWFGDKIIQDLMRETFTALSVL